MDVTKVVKAVAGIIMLITGFIDIGYVASTSGMTVQLFFDYSGEVGIIAILVGLMWIIEVMGSRFKIVAVSQA
jgi:hypothetical protein